MFQPERNTQKEREMKRNQERSQGQSQHMLQIKEKVSICYYNYQCVSNVGILEMTPLESGPQPADIFWEGKIIATCCCTQN